MHGVFITRPIKPRMDACFLRKNQLMHRTFLSASMVGPLLFGGCAALSGCGPSTVSAPARPAVRGLPDQLALADAPRQKKAAPVKQAEALTPETEYKFGILDRHTIATHEFVVRNGGDAPLKLAVGETSCKCTAAALDDQEVAPGDSTTVRLEWNTGDDVGPYRQWSSLITNDPTRREIILIVDGSIRGDYRIEPPTILLGDIVPGDSPPAGEVVVISNRDSDFLLDQCQVTSDAMQATVTPLSADRLRAFGAAHGYVVRLQVSGDLPKGDVFHAINVAVKPSSAKDEVQRLSIPIEGRVLGRIAVMGPLIDQFGHIRFGTKAYGVGAKARLKVVVRDDEPQLKLTNLRVEPSFVKVALTPSPANPRHYDLLVEVPPDAPPCAHRGDAMAKIHFDFAHPRITTLDLQADFSIRAPRDLP